jgi:ubiquitin-like protein Pup
MADQTMKNKPKKCETDCPKKKGADMSKKKEELNKDADDLLDAIDEVLEENCEEFVKNYVQRGGQ